jgi:hypothetical protein
MNDALDVTRLGTYFTTTRRPSVTRWGLKMYVGMDWWEKRRDGEDWRESKREARGKESDRKSSKN